MAYEERLDSLGPAELRRRNSAKWSTYEPDVLALWVAEMDFPTAPVVLAALREAVEREVLGYPCEAAAGRLALAVARWCAERYRWPVDPAGVHVLPDVLKGVELAIDATTPAGAPVVLPTPAYPPFFELPVVTGRPLVEVPMRLEGGRWRLELEGIERAFAAGAGSIVLCSPANPLGRRFEQEELEALAALVEHHGARVVADEIHAPLVYGRPHLPYAAISETAAAHAVTLTSASKGWNLPGLKCAVAITTNLADRERFRRLPYLRTHGASTLGIEASIAAFEQGLPWLEETLAQLDANRRLLGELLGDELAGIAYRQPEATYLAWLDCSPLGLSEEPAAFFLRRARVACNPGSAFGRPYASWVRLNFATTGAILRQAVEAMGAAVRSR